MKAQGLERCDTVNLKLSAVCRVGSPLCRTVPRANRPHLICAAPESHPCPASRSLGTRCRRPRGIRRGAGGTTPYKVPCLKLREHSSFSELDRSFSELARFSSEPELSFSELATGLGIQVRSGVVRLNSPGWARLLGQVVAGRVVTG